jgi:TPR repeat protein
MLGKTYWNGDGVAKDNAVAATWWRMAYRAKHPEAAFLLGQEAFVRLMKNARSPQEVDPSTLQEAISLFDTAAKSDPSPTARAQAANELELLREFRRRRGR